MSMFNDDQRDYMRSLATIPPEHRCWCGWYKLGECYGGCNNRHPGRTRADFLAVACPECRTLPPHHVLGCSHLNEQERNP